MSLVAVLLAADDVDEALVETCGARPTWFCEAAWRLTHNRLLARGADWLITKPLAAALIVTVAWLINRWARRGITATVHRLTRSSRMAMTALEKLGATDPDLGLSDARAKARAETLSVVGRASISWLIWLVAALLVLGVFNINLGPLLAGAGIAALAVGLGAQSFVRDCIAGFFIIMEDQCGVGDEVDIGQAIGTVESLSLRMLQVRAPDGTLWTVPNGAVVSVGNRTRSWSQGLVDVTVAPEANVDTALTAIEEAVDELAARDDMHDVLLQRPAVLGVERFDGAGPVLRVSVRTRPGSQWTTMRELRLGIARALAAHGVPLPPPPGGRPPA